MKIATLFSVASLVQAGLAFAVSRNAHENFHVERRDPANAVTKTITTTYYQTVIWVDDKGNPVSTEINTPPTPVANPTGHTASAAHSNDQSGQKKPAPVPGSSPLPASQSTSHAPSSTPVDLASSRSGSDTGGNSNPGSSDNVQGASAGSTAPGGMGVCYDMINSQGRCKDKSTINSEFGFLKGQGYGVVRVYDIGCPVGDFVASAAQNGLRVMVGINSIANLAGDLAKLISMVGGGNWGPVNTVYIGNELVNSGAASAAQVAGAVSSARGTLSAAGYTGAVVTVDTFNVMQSDPTICSTSDYCAANAHAFFDPNTSAERAGTFVLNAYNSVAKTNNGKQVIITESGWPWQGSCNGQACPSPENQKAAMNSLMKSFAGMPSQLYIFQAYNAGYKSPGQYGVEQFFGVYDTDHYNGGIGSV